MTNELIYNLAKKIVEQEFGYETELISNKKINKKKEGFIIKTKESNMLPILYFEDIRDKLDENFTENDLYNLIDYALKSKKTFLSNKNIPIIDNQLIKRNKDKIYFGLMNKEKNKELLENIVSLDFIDLSLFFYIEFNLDNGDKAEIKITNKMLEYSEITIDELYDIALNNINKNCSISIGPISNLIPLPNISNILYAGLLNGISYGAAIMTLLNKINFPQEFSDEIYVIPSSIREVILIDKTFIDDDMVNRMIETICEINQSEVVGDDYLSDSLYIYNINNKNIKKVEL